MNLTAFPSRPPGIETARLTPVVLVPTEIEAGDRERAGPLAGVSVRYII